MPRRAAPPVALVLFFASALAVVGCGDGTPPTAPVSKAAVQKEAMKNEDGTPMKTK